MDPNVRVLKALYELTGGDPNLPVPVSPTLVARAEVQDLSGPLRELAHRALIRTEPPNLVFLTAQGVRAMFMGLAHEARRQNSGSESQDIPIEAPDDSGDEDEMDLGSIMDLVREGRTRPRGESGVRARPSAGSSPAVGRIQTLQLELEALTRDLALSAELPIAQWSQALELRTEMLRLLETFRRLVQPRV